MLTGFIVLINYMVSNTRYVVVKSITGRNALILFKYNVATMAINMLESIPDHIDGQLLACVGDRISLICSRNEDLSSGVTRWTVTSPTIPCDSVVDHRTTSEPEPCGPFMFQNVTQIGGSQITVLSSTAVATANASMSGAVIGCSTSDFPQLSMQIGPNITLCIPGKSLLTINCLLLIQFS